MEVRERTVSAHGRDVSLFIVAGEHSGDALGAKLMAALNQGRGGRVRYLGVGGPQMAAQGLVSLFPLEDVAVMGPVAIAARFPQILSRVYRTVSAAAAAEPDAVIIIDSPEFTHPIAKRIRQAVPRHPDHRLRVAERVGVASGPRPQDARVYRSCARAVALRAGCP